MTDETKKGNLETLLETIFSEDNPPPQPEKSSDIEPVDVERDSSLDQVVDRYIIRYEKEAIPTVDSYEDNLYGENKIQNYSDVVLEALNEAEEDEEELVEDEPVIAPDEDPGLDLEPEPDTEEKADADEDTEEIPVAQTPQINLQDFARNIARMVNNYDALLNPKNIILNRVSEYVQNNYDTRTAEELMDILDTNYSLRTDEENEERNEDWPTHYSVGALSTEG